MLAVVAMVARFLVALLFVLLFFIVVFKKIYGRRRRRSALRNLCSERGHKTTTKLFCSLFCYCLLKFVSQIYFLFCSKCAPICPTFTAGADHIEQHCHHCQRLLFLFFFSKNHQSGNLNSVFIFHLHLCCVCASAK